MAEELQSLLDKINADGIQKAENERRDIIAAAKKEAAEIIAKANSDAAAVIEKAGKDAEAFHARAVAASAQAARDAALQLREELINRLNASVSSACAQAFSAEYMAQLITTLAAAFAADPDAQITVRTAVKDREALDNALKSALADSFSKKPKVLGTAGISGGLEVDFKDGKCFFDFTADAVTDLLKEYIGGQLAEIFKADA